MAYESFIAANRFGFGLSAAGDAFSGTGRAGLGQQIEQGRAASIPTYNLPDSPTLVRETIALLKQKKEDKGTDAAKQEKQDYHETILNALAARFQANLQGIPLVERLTLFWSNHFTVSMKSKPLISTVGPAMERDAIRPHVLGKFEDMLQAVTHHPAMLIYLDNATSIGPNSVAGQRRHAGLNENLGRELLELHTLGAQGGYTQTDVTTMAKILTGWTLDRPQQGGTGDFLFVDRFHEPGAQTLLGRTYDQPGVAQGQAVLHDLAHHPSTAHFIATKLVRHFVADDPAPDDISAIAGTFSNTGGDLAAVTQALIDLPSVWANPTPKVKTPYELLLSSVKATGLPPDQIPFKRIYAALNMLGQAPFTAPSPAGWSDRADDWISAEALMNRIELCHMIAQRLTPQGVSPSQIADALIGPVASPDTMTAIRRAPSPVDGFALVLASAEFQRR